MSTENKEIEENVDIEENVEIEENTEIEENAYVKENIDTDAKRDIEEINDFYREREQKKDLERQEKYEQRKRKVYIYRALIVIVVVLIAALIFTKVNSKKDSKPKDAPVKQEKEKDTDKKNQKKDKAEEKKEEKKEEKEEVKEDKEEQLPELDLSTLPADLVEALEFNPELEEFARGYTTKKDKSFDVDLSKEAASGEIPLILQWDERWGYNEYAGQMFGLSGCGPATLSMLCLYEFQDPSYTPEYIAQFSKENGYVMDGKGSYWTLIGEGGKQLGLDIMELNPVKEDIVWYLQEGYPVVCIMGPGEFTQTGHFIILSHYNEDGTISIRDSASVEKSNKLWTFDELGSQIQNAWVVK